jgi:hypothetical protein
LLPTHASADAGDRAGPSATLAPPSAHLVERGVDVGKAHPFEVLLVPYRVPFECGSGLGPSVRTDVSAADEGMASAGRCIEKLAEPPLRELLEPLLC